MTVQPPSTGPFTQILNGYLGNMSSDMQKVVWNSFLEEQGLTANPPDNDTAELVSFSQYVNGYYSSILAPDIKTGEKTKVVWTIFDILIELMSTSTNTQLTSQKAQVFLSKQQDAYRKEMAGTVLYVGAAPGAPDSDGDMTVSTPNSNPALFNLGYGNITLKDVFTNMIGQADANYAQSLRDPLATNSATTFILGRPKLNEDSTILGGIKIPHPLAAYFSFSVQKTGPAEYNLLVSFNAEGLSYANPTAKAFGIANIVNSTLASANSISSNSSPDLAYDEMSSIFNQVYNQYKGLQYELPSTTKDPNANILYNLKIDWQNDINFSYVGSDQVLQTKSTTATQMRAEKNKQAQSFIDANKSRMDILKDFSNQQGRIVDAAANSKTQTHNIIRSIISQLQAIANSIFKR